MNPHEYHHPQTLPETQSDDGNNARAAFRLRLSLAIKQAIEQRGLSHADAGLMARTPRTSITAIVNGKLDRVSFDRLVTIADRLGVKIGLRLSTHFP